jgi:HEAT repeat protein
MPKRMSTSRAVEDLHNEVAEVRVQAIVCLRQRGKKGDLRAISALVRVMDDPDVRIWAQAVLALGHLRAGYDVLVSHLLGDPSGHVRFLCAGMLARPEYPRATDGVHRSARG